MYKDFYPYSTNKGEKIMNYTFHRVASFCGLRLSYYLTAALLATAFFILVPTDYKTASPLYILLSLAVMPSIIKSIFFSTSQTEKRENDLSFPLFCKKYHYDFAMYKSMNIAYLLLFVLLAAWHISYSSGDGIPVLITLLPALIATISLFSRILGVVGYRLFFRFFPLKAMR